MDELIYKCPLSDIPDGGAKAIQVGDEHLALFRVGNEVYALEELCPHRGAPLSEGAVHEGTVRCPWHASKFELKTGKVLTPPARRDLKAYPVTISSSGEVSVEVGA